MPVAAVTSVLAAGFRPMFAAATAPLTTAKAANDWARAYADYVVAGGIPAARIKQAAFATALVTAFDPALAGAGPALMIQALLTFWIGLPVPAQAGTVTAFIPLSLDVSSPQPDNATPEDEARGLAQVISGLTLGAVKVTVPPGVIVPLL
jgi:hypothetical protein